MRETWRRDMQNPASGGEALAMLAHDLRTPMCSVAGAAQMALMASHEGKAVDEQMGEILRAVQAMDLLISHLCGTGKRSDARTCEELEGELSALMLPRAQEKGQALRLDLSALRGMRLGAAYTSLERALLNLLSNAVKYTPEGGSVELMGWMEGARTAVFVVSDSGMGMKREFLQRMYLPFARAKESAHLPGTGLGLAIVRRCVKEMGGSIRVRSEWGKGTEFILRVPLAGEAAE